MGLRQRLKPVVFRSFLAAMIAAESIVALFLGVVLYGLHQAGPAWVLPQDVPYDGFPFVRRGSRYVATGIPMAPSSFAAEKPANEFRVFIFGGSEAMGIPYTLHSSLPVTPSEWFSHLLPHKGGMPYWLGKYLKKLLPRRTVTIVNAAVGGTGMDIVVKVMNGAARIGRPDLFVVLSGNNERDSPMIKSFNLAPGASLANVVNDLTRNFKRQLAAAISLSEAHEIPTYILTVPDNLRDWEPNAEGPKNTFDAKRAILWWNRAQSLDHAKKFLQARDCYARAKDLDTTFLRARSPWNAAIRAVKGRYARVIDMERIMFFHARDGIPGADLFHDYCHMKLGGYRSMAFELARRIRRDMGIARPLQINDIPLASVISWRLKLLYWAEAFRWARVFPAIGFRNTAAICRNYLDAYREVLNSERGAARSRLPDGHPPK